MEKSKPLTKQEVLATASKYVVDTRGANPFWAVCPVCGGHKEIPVPDKEQKTYQFFASYNKERKTIACHNCGGQYQSMNPIGLVKVTPDNKPCIHYYRYTNPRRCFHIYDCEFCGDHYEIDSSD